MTDTVSLIQILQRSNGRPAAADVRVAIRWVRRS